MQAQNIAHLPPFFGKALSPFQVRDNPVYHVVHRSTARRVERLRPVRDSGGNKHSHGTQTHQLVKVPQGLTTKSDKIRALAQAGYDRTEISKILDIRYQHVRNVLLQSGFTGGLRREAEAEREPVEVDATPAPREDTSWKVLTDAGFELIGEWTQDPQTLLRLDAKAPSLPGVYAFIVDDVVVYVGLTLNALQNTDLINTAAGTNARKPVFVSTAGSPKHCVPARRSRFW